MTAQLGRPTMTPSARPRTSGYTELLERDLEIAQNENERLELQVQTLQARLERYLTREKKRPRHRGADPELVEAVHQLESPGLVYLTPGVVLDSDVWQVIHPGGSEQFSPTEWLFMRRLAMSRGRLVPREQLVRLFIEFSPAVREPDHALRVNLSRARVKLRAAGVAHLLTTIKYSGYRLELTP